MSDGYSEQSIAVRQAAEELTDGERALARATYAQPFEDMRERQQRQFLRILEDMPEDLRAGLDGNLVTKDQFAEGMYEVYTSMVANDEFPEKWKDGAAVFAMALHEKFGIDMGDQSD